MAGFKTGLQLCLFHSCGWLEWFTDGPLAGQYRRHLARPDKLLLPAIILSEVYKVLKRDAGEETALLAAGYMKRAGVVPLDETIALAAADITLAEHLAMADAIILATARAHRCEIVTSVADLKGKEGVRFIARR